MALSSRYETTGFEVQTRDPLLEGLKATWQPSMTFCQPGNVAILAGRGGCVWGWGRGVFFHDELRRPSRYGDCPCCGHSLNPHSRHLPLPLV